MNRKPWSVSPAALSALGASQQKCSVIAGTLSRASDWAPAVCTENCVLTLDLARMQFQHGSGLNGLWAEVGRMLTQVFLTLSDKGNSRGLVLAG